MCHFHILTEYNSEDLHIIQIVGAWKFTIYHRVLATLPFYLYFCIFNHQTKPHYELPTTVQNRAKLHFIIRYKGIECIYYNLYVNILIGENNDYVVKFI